MKRKSDWVFPEIAPSIGDAGTSEYGLSDGQREAMIERSLVVVAFVLGLLCSFLVF